MDWIWPVTGVCRHSAKGVNRYLVVSPDLASGTSMLRAIKARSRQKLADAIIQAQEAAGLDQLILVSHDDAFEGKIENAIFLEKSASRGTAMVL